MGSYKKSMGKLIVLEGIDGSGKTTQAKLLSESEIFKGKNVLLTKEPTSWVIGSFLRKWLESKEVVDPRTMQLLFTADRSHHMENEVLPALRRGDYVISDRFAFSTIAYGAAFGVDRKWLESANKPFLDLVSASILIDIEPEVALKRIAGSRETSTYFEKIDTLKRIRKEYLAAVKSYPNFLVVDASKRIEDVTSEIVPFVKKVLRL
ncbi:MAG: dTMP kinase [Candidatus Micrarchaeia archaeon]